ncbi:PASTA domain-containing protein [Mycolicibacterium confluentis]|nr:hypothetical protein [Mycolicibacterium confluentis]MCV7319870.1 hypothetical protein [Mycolicibacterium confluentis]
MRIVKACAGAAVAALMVSAVAHAQPEDAESDDVVSEDVVSEDAGWEMPDIKEMNLQDADDALKEAAAGAEFELNTENINGVHQDQVVYEFWKVCWQAPEAGEMVTPDSWVGVGVTRYNIDCW